ncbi:endonuclease/exonuclease/phosphatase family protein [Roseobacter weihaiensis]|uniref:endonuclease/exonuclease/phosphatase family protein n=1 Tax=Roseobacter weihaiensis TaxID=2763262 RepID=UPI001D0AA96E|nr:endonuclease/exonuclease/phosphatase family protein [Roseobacter sp. H9]
MSDAGLRFASYNIRKARGLDNKRKPERTLQVINGLNADIVVLQEADRRHGARKPAIPRRLIETETDLDLLDLTEKGVSLGWHGNAVLVRPGLKVGAIDRLDLPGLEPRGAVRMTFDVAGGFCLVATHLGLRRRDRRAQLEVLRHATQDCGHTVMAGDFNEWSRRKGLEALDGRFQVHAPGRSFHARRPIAALDRFAISHGLSFDDGGVEDGTLARRASDHLPIWADIVVPPKASIC